MSLDNFNEEDVPNVLLLGKVLLKLYTDMGGDWRDNLFPDIVVLDNESIDEAYERYLKDMGVADVFG